MAVNDTTGKYCIIGAGACQKMRPLAAGHEQGCGEQLFFVADVRHGFGSTRAHPQAFSSLFFATLYYCLASA